MTIKGWRLPQWSAAIGEFIVSYPHQRPLKLRSSSEWHKNARLLKITYLIIIPPYS